MLPPHVVRVIRRLRPGQQDVTPHVEVAGGAEIARLRQVYRDRTSDEAIRNRYSLANRGNLFNWQQRDDTLASLISCHFGGSLRAQRIVDVGCGRGELLRDLQRYGASAESYWGVDLMVDRVEAARARFPDAHFLSASAHHLPFDDQEFDLVCQFTLMSSIVDPDTKRKVADELDRVLRPGGRLLWYDYWINPLNRSARGIRVAEIRHLFPSYSHDVRQITLAPPIARVVGPRSASLLPVLSRVRLLRTHYAAMLTKPK